MKHNMKVLLLAALVLGVLVLACGDPQPVPCNELEGTARFTPDAIERCGCPDEDKVPVWYVIPGCPAT